MVQREAQKKADDRPIEYVNQAIAIPASWIARGFQILFRLGDATRDKVTIVVGLVILLGAVYLPWWGPQVWDLIRDSYLASHDTETAEPGTLSIAVMEFDNDQGAEYSQRLADQLGDHFKGTIQVLVEPVTLDDSWQGTRTARDAAFGSATYWLKRTGATIVVWGKVWSDRDYAVAMVSKYDSDPHAIARIDLDQNEKDIDSGSDQDAVMSGKIVGKALEMETSAFTANKASEKLSDVVASLAPLVVELNDKLSNADKVALVTDFSQLTLAMSQQGDNGPLREFALPALKRLIQNPDIISDPSSAAMFRLRHSLGDLENRIGDHAKAIDALKPIVEAAEPDEITDPEFARVEIAYANANEQLAEFGPNQGGLAQQISEFEEAKTFDSRAADLYVSYSPLDQSTAFDFDRPLAQAGNAKFVEPDWSRAKDELGLAIVREAEFRFQPAMTNPSANPVGAAFDALKCALRFRQPNVNIANYAFSLSRLGLAYQVEGQYRDDLFDTWRAKVCLEAAQQTLNKYAAGDAGAIASSLDSVNSVLKTRRAEQRLIPTSWVCSTPPGANCPNPKTANAR
jgi:tetratricopeptide (TPR) repeat protein